MSKRELHICNFAVAHMVDLTYKCKTMFLKKTKQKNGKKEKGKTKQSYPLPLLEARAASQWGPQVLER